LTSHRYVEKRSHDRRIKLRSGAACQFLSGISRRHRTFVRTDGRHDLEGVSHGDDSCAKGDLITRDAMGVSGAVEILVVLLYG
jgi:hypothetical protein